MEIIDHGEGVQETTIPGAPATIFFEAGIAHGNLFGGCLVGAVWAYQSSLWLVFGLCCAVVLGVGYSYKKRQNDAEFVDGFVQSAFDIAVEATRPEDEEMN